MHTNVNSKEWEKAVAAAVRIELARRRVRPRAVAALLGVHVETVLHRLDASIAFNVSELELIARMLHLDVQVFFDQAERIRKPV